MAAKKKTIMLKHEKGALHIGGGRFFYAGVKHSLPVDEADELLERYPDDLKAAKADQAVRGDSSGGDATSSGGNNGGDSTDNGAGGNNADQTE